MLHVYVISLTSVPYLLNIYIVLVKYYAICQHNSLTVQWIAFSCGATQYCIWFEHS